MFLLKEIYHIEAWLSLVERCVRDAEVVGSNPVASTLGRGTPEVFLIRLSEFFCAPVSGTVSINIHKIPLLCYDKSSNLKNNPFYLQIKEEYQ